MELTQRRLWIYAAPAIPLAMLSLFDGEATGSPALPWLYGLTPALIKLALAVVLLCLVRDSLLHVQPTSRLETDHASTPLVTRNRIDPDTVRL